MDNGASSYRRFLSGDDESFTEIIKNYMDGLMLYLNTFTSNIYVAEDLAEDTFVKLVTKRPKFSGKSSFKTWLYAIGRNAALDHLKKQSKISDGSIDDLCILQADEENLERAYIRKEDGLRLHKCLKKLKAEYRQVLWLKYFESFSNAQIAKVMRKSVHNTEALVYRAKKALKAELEKEKYIYEDL